MSRPTPVEQESISGTLVGTAAAVAYFGAKHIASEWLPYVRYCEQTPCPHCQQYTLAPVASDAGWFVWCLGCHRRIASYRNVLHATGS